MPKTLAELKAEIFSALAHSNRIRILESLRDDMKCNCELLVELKLEQSNLSRHLKALVDAGILISWKEGVRVNYKIADNRIFKILELGGAIGRAGIERKLPVLK